jgi:hypothetical protein
MLRQRLKLSGILAISSFLALVILLTSTSPADNIIYSAFFFGLALVFLVSTGYTVVRLQAGTVSNKNRYRIIALSLVFLILLMFRSAQSLNWVYGVILILIGFGLVFYISKRSY